MKIYEPECFNGKDSIVALFDFSPIGRIKAECVIRRSGENYEGYYFLFSSAGDGMSIPLENGYLKKYYDALVIEFWRLSDSK